MTHSTHNATRAKSDPHVMASARVLLAGLCLLGVGQATSSAAPKPHILFILSDGASSLCLCTGTSAACVLQRPLQSQSAWASPAVLRVASRSCPPHHRAHHLRLIARPHPPPVASSRSSFPPPPHWRTRTGTTCTHPCPSRSRFQRCWVAWLGDQDAVPGLDGHQRRHL